MAILVERFEDQYGPQSGYRIVCERQLPPKENSAMDIDRIAGSVKEIKGSVKQAVGKAVGDAKLESDGRADKAEGTVQNAIGGVKDAAREALKK